MSDTGWISYPNGIVALVLAVVLALTVVQMRRTLVDVAARRLGGASGAAAGVGLALIALRAGAERVDDASGWTVALAITACVLLAVALARVGAQLAVRFAHRHASRQEHTVAPMKLEPGRRAVWSSTLSSPWLLVPGLAVLLLGPLIMFAPGAPLWLLAVVVLVGVACLSLASIRVTVGADGLSVKYGVLPWPSTDIAVERIASASVIDIRPQDWGGWGYRGTLTLMRQAAVVLRAGPGIRVDLTDGRVFAVTIDEPDTGVALLNAELARRPIEQLDRLS